MNKNLNNGMNMINFNNGLMEQNNFIQNNQIFCNQQMQLFNPNNNMNNFNLFNNNKLNKNNSFNVFFKGIIKDFDSYGYFYCVGVEAYPKETIKNLISRFFQKIEIELNEPEKNNAFIFHARKLSNSMIVEEVGLKEGDVITIRKDDIIGAGPKTLEFYIYIKFIKFSNFSSYNHQENLKGILKLCLLKEIGSKFHRIDLHKFKDFPEMIQYIMQILICSEVYAPDKNDFKQNIEIILERAGHNIFNFSNFVDQEINSECLTKIIKLLNKKDLVDINDTILRLGKYNKYIDFFEKKFRQSIKESIFEFAVVSLVVLDRDDYDSFETEREKCPNREDLLIYHGTQIHPISCILTSLFRRSEERCYQHGKGIYFTDSMDYCWFYGGSINNRANTNRIPKVGETFTAISSLVYYDKNGYLRVNDYKTRIKPGKNEINFAYAGCNLETIIDPEPDYRKFVGTEYVIWNHEQICPFISIKLARVEYCVIWRDINFSQEAIYNNEFDEIFKQFLKDRMKYIKQSANFNIYSFKTTENALRLVRRKKYNKIILISNVGPDLDGKNFIDGARKILGNDVIALFLAYDIKHLDWIKNYKNAFFSNEAKFYEEYLDCFNQGDKIKESIIELIAKEEKHYNVKFNFDNKFLDFPLYKPEGKYSDLTF